MTLRDRMRALFSPANPSYDERAFNPTAIPKNSEIVAGFSGIAGDSALRLAAVHACVRLLADSVSTLPLDVYRKVNGASQPVDPTPVLIRDPLPEISVVDWLYQVMTSLALRGNAYLLVESRDRFEFPTRLRPIHPDDVEVKTDKSGRVTHYMVRHERVETFDIVHIRRFSLPGVAEGLSPVAAHATSLGIGLSAESYGASYFRDAASPSSILRTDQSLTADEVRRVQKTWVATHGGRRLPAVLTGGFDWKPITINPAESQFLETRQYQRSEVAMIFGVPPHMIGDVSGSTSWGTGIEQQSIGFVTYTLRPWLTIIETALTRQIPRGQFVKFNANGLLRGDAKSRFEGYTQARTAGWLSPNEIRALEDLPAITAGDNYLQPLNMGPLGSDPLASKTPAPPAPGTDGGQP